MQPKSHINLKIWNHICEPFVFTIIKNMFKLVYFGNTNYIRKYCKLHNITDLFAAFYQANFSIYLFYFCFREFPYKQKSLSKIFIGGSSILIDMSMNNLSYLIHKSHYIFFKYLCHLIKSSNITKSKNVYIFISWNKRIKVTTVLWISSYVSCNNLGSSHSKT